MADTSNGLLVLNFWATFCKPCVEEIPHFIKTANKYKDRGLKLLLVSLDLPAQYPVKLKAFAKKHQFNAPLAWLDESNADYFCPKVNPKWSGAIPATLFINNKTGYRNFVEEQIPHEQLKIEIRAILKKG